MMKVQINVSHRKVDHTVEIELPQSIDEAVKVMGEDTVFKLFVTQLKTKLAGDAWADFERESKGQATPGRTTDWQKQLFKK